MSHLKFLKAGVSICPVIAKETILSKIINTVHVFSIDTAYSNFDDLQKKYISTILKLDDSKTIVLETKGEDVVCKNINGLSHQEGDTIHLEYSSILEEDSSALFLNYSFFLEIPVGAIFGFEGSEIQYKLLSNANDFVTLICIQAGTVMLGQKIIFQNYVPKVSFLSERDKKNIIYGVQSGVNVLSAGSLRKPEDIADIRKFLRENNGEGMKVYARLGRINMESEYLEALVHTADGVMIHHNDRKRLDDEIDFIHTIKSYHKPIILVLNTRDLQDQSWLEKRIEDYIALGVDVISLSESLLTESDDPLDAIQSGFAAIQDQEARLVDLMQSRKLSYLNADGIVNENDYLINILPNLIKDTHAKIILCYTSDGSTAAKLSTLSMDVPLLVFTRDDFSYRYNNLLRGVKGYKIGQTSTYAVFKQIGKEMIRIHFKGNISLDDKVVILTLCEDKDKKGLEGLINGIEIYKFKNI